MKPNEDLYAQVDGEGHLVLSPELASRYGIKPGARVYIDGDTNCFRVLRSAAQLAKLYIEPTNQCNLDCRTCIRNIWNEPLGKMSDAVFARVIEGLHAFSPPPTVFFGGFGEPLFHPKIVEMVAQAKSLGAPVELITNGTLLTADLSRELVTAGIDMVWVSIDGATPESYADVRLGAALPQVLENVAHFRRARLALGRPQTQLGIAFVAMKRNIADLPAVRELARQLGTNRFLVTNVLPYTKEMCDEVLYSSLRETYPRQSEQKQPLSLPPSELPWSIEELPLSCCEGSDPLSLLTLRLSLPQIDMNESTHGPLCSIMPLDTSVTWAGSNFRSPDNRCPFVESGAGAIGWDGSLSPCLPLLHSYVSFLDDWERRSRHWAIGNVVERSLTELWNAPEHIAFRERVQAFDFAPCVFCGGCDLLDTNEEDCFGNVFPTCGGCLWAQGLIQCP